MSVPDRNRCLAEFPYTADNYDVTNEMKAAFDLDGGIVMKGLFDKAEMDHINDALTGNENFTKHAYGVPDGEEGVCELLIWNHPGSDVTGMVARCEKVVNTCEKLLGGEVYHYHSKLLMKNAHTGGQFQWHQDYGYWYKNGCLKPDMMTVFIAIDATTIENGCLQMLKGSHHFGRIDHGMFGGQQQADPIRVDALKKQCDLVYAKLQPGDAVFFHSNLLHCSSKNKSGLRRWALACAYNRADNDPIFKHHCPNYTPLDKVPDSAVLTCTNYTDLSGKDFLDPKEDKTVKFVLKNNEN